jgi:uncharacterized membrane protein YgcG
VSPKTSTTYKVTGTQEVLGHQPGEEFDAYLSPDQEATLVGSHLTRVKLPDSQTSGQPSGDSSAGGTSSGSSGARRE